MTELFFVLWKEKWFYILVKQNDEVGKKHNPDS